MDDEIREYISNEIMDIMRMYKDTKVSWPHLLELIHEVVTDYENATSPTVPSDIKSFLKNWTTDYLK